LNAVMLTFDADATRSALPFERLIVALERMFVAGCEVPQRHSHTIDNAAAGSVIVLLMPAWQAGRYLGIKTVSVAARNAERGLPGLYATYTLYDATTGAPLASIDGSEITSRRTAAASALAASRLARRDSRRLLVVGAGRVASLLAPAYRAVLPIAQVTIWDRKPEQAQSLASRLIALGFSAAAARDLPAAAAQADIVSCATLATEPLIDGRWLRAGSHLDLIGSFTPAMREADDDCFAGASIYVDTDEALQKSGDLLGPMMRGVFARGDVRGTLADLCRGSVAGRTADNERTVFKSVGTALEDLAAAILVYESAATVNAAARQPDHRG